MTMQNPIFKAYCLAYVFILPSLCLVTIVLTFDCGVFFLALQGSGGRPGFGRGAGGYSSAAPSGSGLP